MNQFKTVLTGAAVSAVIFGAQTALAQYAPPPPPTPFPGFINEWLRKDDPYAARWDIGGSVRERLEIKENAGVVAGNDFKEVTANKDNNYLLTRVRARVGYTDKWWNFMVEGRHSSSTGDNRPQYVVPGTRVNGPEADGPIDLHQAYVTLGNHKEFPLSVKVGRQELSYGEERLVGAFAWNNIGRVFDAAKLRWQNSLFGVDLFSARVVIPDDNNINQSTPHEYFSGAYFNTKLIPKNWTEFYFLARNADAKNAGFDVGRQVAQAGARDIYTVGLRMKSGTNEWGNFDYLADLMGQFGRFVDTRAGVAVKSQDQEAYAAVLQAGYTFPDAFGTPRVALEYAYSSGDDNVNDGKHGTFDNLYPTNHKFYGYMDLVSLQNIHDIRPMIQLKPTRRWSSSVEGHLFWLANTSDNFYNVGGAPRGAIGGTAGTGYGINRNSSYVGSEIDFINGFALTRYAQLEVGYGHFFVGGYVDQSLAKAGGSTDADYIYTQLNINF